MTAFKQVLTDALNRSRQWLRKRMPVILQDEMSECGIACIAMISSYYGKNLSLREMRQHYRVARDGMSLLQVVKMCEEHNLISRPLRLTLANTVHLRTPSILFWNNRHYVVLESTNARGLHIVDPAVGRRFYTWAQALTMFSSVALEVQPGLSFTTKVKGTDKQSLSFTHLLERNPWLLRYLIPMGLLSIFGYVGAIAAPKLFALTIDEVVAKNDQDFLYLILYIFGALFIFKTLAAWLRAILDMRLRVALSLDLATGVVAWLLRLPVQYFERRAAADLLRRTQATEKAYLQFTSGTMDITIDLLASVLFLALMALINPMLAGLSIALCGVFFVFRSITLPAMERHHKASIEAETARNVTLLSTLGNIESMKLYQYEADRLATWNNHQADMESARARVQHLQVMNNVVHEGLSHSHSLLVSAIGALAVLHGTNSVGDLFAFVLYKDLFMGCLFKAIDNYINLRLVRVELLRVEQIVDEPREAMETCVYSAKGLNEPDPVTSISLDGALFRYSSFDRPTFKDVHLSLPDSGRKIAIFGPSGCGKSTLLKVLAGFYPPDQGQLMINGVALQRFGLRRYQKNVAYVTAIGEIIDGSVIENIAMGIEPLDGEYLLACVEQAGLLDSIRALSNGFNTLLGPGGVQLSSGQRQRLLIARALFRRPSLLLLDEPTSHLDGDARDVIIETLRRLPMLCVVVTHDLAVTKACDRVLQMVDGQLVPMPENRP